MKLIYSTTDATIPETDGRKELDFIANRAVNRANNRLTKEEKKMGKIWFTEPE